MNKSTDYDIIIIGAGASGLSAARELARAGKKVMILEARDRTGGRIFSIKDPAFPIPVEAGAEFIHGRRPLTFSLLKEYGIAQQPVHGTFFSVQSGDMDKTNDFIADHHRLLARRLKDLEIDVSVENFLEAHFKGEKFKALRNSVRGFVSGYDAADPKRASTFAFREEWLNGDEEQSRVAGGYSMLIHALQEECIRRGCLIRRSSVVKEVHWQPFHVEVITADGMKVSSRQIMITVPVAVLARDKKYLSSISFFPELPEVQQAAKAIGYGGVIKIVLLFKHAFWKDPGVKEKTGRNMERLAFVFSNEKIPTWWTQSPDPSPLLTGWLGGARADAFEGSDENQILHAAMQSLSAIFKISSGEIAEYLDSSRIFNWNNDPFALGAYSYITIDADHFKKKLIDGISDTVFFAGEAMLTGYEAGTVETALQSGFGVAGKIIETDRERN